MKMVIFFHNAISLGPGSSIDIQGSVGSQFSDSVAHLLLLGEKVEKEW